MEITGLPSKFFFLNGGKLCVKVLTIRHNLNIIVMKKAIKRITDRFGKPDEVPKNWPDDYVFDRYPYEYIPIGSRLVSIRDNLYELDKRALEKRTKDCFDLRFCSHTYSICHHVQLLEYVSTYGHLTDTFIDNVMAKNLSEKVHLELQKNLCSVYKGAVVGKYRSVCSNLLCRYLRRWDLYPEVKSVIRTDERFEHVWEIYQQFRCKD